MNVTRCAALVTMLWMSAFGGTAWCKNYVYKGTIATIDLTDGTKAKIPGYVIFGDARPVDVSDDYLFVDSSLVVVSPALGKKRVLRSPGPGFRSLRKTVTVKGKPRTTVILTHSAGDATTGSGARHAVFAVLVSGLVTDPLYDMPPKLTGPTLSSQGQAQLSGPSSGGGTGGTWKLTLVRDLTDPIPPSETLAQTVDRVTAFLASRGFIEFIP
jgi:hypothetical protein